MLKQKQYDIAETNIALLGSDLEKNVKLAAAETEEAWKGAGTEVGLLIWRIEKFKVVPVAKEHYGEFYSGDSYIILKTFKKDPNSEALSYDVYFWLGAETTQDEAGTAAYKTVEIDDYLRGAAVQHREIEDHESPSFLANFTKFQVLAGGIESGFRRVTPETHRTRLLHVKGANMKRMVVRECPEISYKALNHGDVFILDTAMTIYQWNGNEAGVMEKAKGAEVARAIDDQRKGIPAVVVVEGDADEPDFFKALGGKGPIRSAAEGGADKLATSFEKKLFRLSDASGEMTFDKVATGTVKKGDFDGNDVFVFDCGTEIFVWVGKGSSRDERRGGLQYAQDYLRKYDRPIFLPITRVLEGSESSYFNNALDA